MKKLLCLFSALTIVLASCSNDDSSNSADPIVESGKLQFDFENKTFISTSVQAIVGDDFISISAIRATNGDHIQITVPSNKTGTYTFSNNSNPNENLALAYSPSSNEYSAFIALSKLDADDVFGSSDYTDTASITITSIDSKTKKISGTFQFTGLRFNSSNKIETKTITKGSFKDIAFTSEAPVNNDNSFSTKLDGSNFLPTNIFATSSLGKIAITANRGSVENIAILVPNTIKPGTYNVGDSAFNYIIRYSKDLTNQGMFDASKGTITISSHNTTERTINGTFTASLASFFTTEKHEIAQGTFSVKY